MRNVFILLLGLFSLVGNAPQAVANDKLVDRVVAVVNNDIITYRELRERIQFNVRNSGRSVADRAQQEQVLQASAEQLVEEALLRQYAASRNYQVNDADLDRTIANIERANNQPAGSFLEFAGREKETALARIKNDLIQQQILQREILPRITVTTEEVNRILQNLSGQSRVDEREIAQIFLAVNDDSREAAVREQAYEIYKQLSEGADFGNMARTFSQDPAARDGGKLGWFNAGELAAPFESALARVQKGQMTEPVRSPTGWHIFKLMNTRESAPLDLAPTKQVRLLQLSLKVDGNAEDTLKKAAELTKGIRKIGDFETLISNQRSAEAVTGDNGDMNWRNEKDLALEVQDAIKGVGLNRTTKPILRDGSVQVFYVAARREQENPRLAEMRERLTDRMMQSRAERSLSRLLRDLRRNAYIDMRL